MGLLWQGAVGIEPTQAVLLVRRSIYKTPQHVAGGEGVGPSHTVLETVVLPLYEPPTKYRGVL